MIEEFCLTRFKSDEENFELLTKILIYSCFDDDYIKDIYDQKSIKKFILHYHEQDLFTA